MFINTKKEEAETVRIEKELRKAERDTKTRIPLWEKIIQTTMAVFISSVEAEKRQQEHILVSHLRAMDSSVAEDDIRRQKEAQEIFVELKRREAEKQHILQLEEVEKQKSTNLSLFVLAQFCFTDFLEIIIFLKFTGTLRNLCITIFLKIT